jgi:ADP-heptose:LPS heptosyltransferase
MKILLIQLRAIGDVVCTTPAIAYTRAAYPNATIDFLVEPISAPLLQTNPHLNEVLVYDKKHPAAEIRRVRARRYDAVIDFMNNPRTGALTAFSGARWRVGFERSIRRFLYSLPVRPALEPEYVPLRRIKLIQAWLRDQGVPLPKLENVRPSIVLSSDDEAFANNWIKSERLEGRRLVIMLPIHKHAICRWRPEGFRAVARQLSAISGVRVYLGWGPGEETALREVAHGIENIVGFCPPAELRQIGAIYKRASLVLANNSGSMHLAVAVGTPTATIYGPTRPIDWSPSYCPEASNGRDAVLIAPEVACLGCRLKECPVGHLCMTYLSEKTVSAAATELLSASA